MKKPGNWIATGALLGLLLITAGCGEGRPVSAPAPAAQAPAPAAPVAPTESNLTATLRSAAGKGRTVWLVAADEQKQRATAPSCMANSGDTLWSGHYQLVLKEGEQRVPQAISLFGGEILTFNAQRPQMLAVLPGAGAQPDLLVIRQYASCNGSEMVVLALTPDATALKLYPFQFQTDQGLRAVLFASSIERPEPDRITTRSYNNAKGQYSNITWRIDPERALLIEQQDP